MSKLNIEYKIYLEAEDVSQSRIASCASFVKNLLENNCTSVYFKGVELDNESDMDDFTLRLYIDHKVEENECTSSDDAKNFCQDMAEVLDHIAMAHSFLDMEGSFSIDYEGNKESYRFTSESGQGYCDFEELA